MHFVAVNRRLRDPLIADLNGDGIDEILAALHVGGADGRPAAEAIYCWEASGALRWKYEPNHILTFAGGGRFGPAWNVADFVVANRRGGGAEVWASFTDGAWWADFVSRIAADGDASVRLVHGGIVYRLQPVERDGHRVVLGATVSNQHGSAGLVEIDPEAPAARWPIEPSGYQCVDCPSGTPSKYVLLPPSDVARADGAAYNNVLNLLESGGHVVLLTTEERDQLGSAARVFRFTPHGDPIGYAASDAFSALHRAHEARGGLDHPLERCPDASRPVRARSWTHAPDRLA